MRFGQEKSKPVEAAERAGRFAKEKPNSVEKLQKFARDEAKRKREEEEKKKSKPEIDASPSKGLLSRIYSSVVGDRKESKKDKK